MSATTLLLGLAGFVLLVLGAEVMVRGASSLASRFGIPPVIIGLTVVAFGTSAPELAIGIRSAIDGQADIALGNIVGSNILNILLVLGLSAMITPLLVDSRIVRKEIPILIGVSVLTMVFAFNGILSPWEGAVLFVGSLLFTMFTIFSARQDKTLANSLGLEDDIQAQALPVSLVMVLAGLAMLVLGADFLVNSAIIVAKWLGVSELLIGLTVISIGTSLPEIATTLIAAMRGLRDMAVGNVVGSCLFNLLAVAGATAVFSGDGLVVDPALIEFDLPVMLAATVACLPIFATGHLIARWEGALFFFFYIAYTTYLIMASHSEESVQVMRTAMLSFVVPLTFITLLLLWLREIKQKRKQEP